MKFLKRMDKCNAEKSLRPDMNVEVSFYKQRYDVKPNRMPLTITICSNSGMEL
jgi:hypothetical protein